MEIVNKGKMLRNIIEESLKENFIVHDADETICASVGEIVDAVVESLQKTCRF